MNDLDWQQYSFGLTQHKQEVYFRLKKTQEQNLAEPYNQCEEMFDVTYRQAKCENNKYANKYNCTWTNYFSIPGYEHCGKEIPYSEFDSVCEKQCPRECVSIKFGADSSAYESNSTRVYVMYTDTSYIEISQTPKMSGFSLVSSIGGALGLFIGIRFLSLVELFEYLTEISFCFLF